MKTRRGLLILAGLAAVACVTAGPRRWFSSGCSGSGPCDGDGLCVEGFCARSCVTSGDCGDGVCILKHCTSTAAACNTDFCSDGNACTLDYCNPANAACRHEPNDGPCDDGNICTIGDECVHNGDEHLCKAAAKCDDGDPATFDTCDKATGACSHGQ